MGEALHEGDTEDMRDDRAREGDSQPRGAPTSRAAFKFFTSLRDEALQQAERHGPLHGLVRRRQQPWSRILDAIEAELQAATEGNAA